MSEMDAAASVDAEIDDGTIEFRGASPGAMALAGASALALAACGGGGGSAGGIIGGTPGPTPAPAPAPAPAPTPTPTPPPPVIAATQASRFLSQAAIGYSKADIGVVQGMGFTAWLNAQMVLGRPQKFWDYLIAGGYDAAANQNTINGFDAMMWSQLMGSGDIVRQRVGLALLSQWVVGVDGFGGSWRQFVMAAFLDGLWDNAFRNYRDIMEAVSTSVGMGLMLTFLGNVKANAATGAIPDENYARELMQLFTLGLYQLNMDGSLVLSGGQPVPTYTQGDVAQGARVWTGYTYANNTGTTPNRIQLGMIVNAGTHESGASSFLGITIPAGTDGATARKLALDGLFQHANVPPFVSKQLIQHMVTSNPSPAYIQRVANVFANNGSGVRGDMPSVIRAVLTDIEARDDTAAAISTTFGKLREPIVRLVQWAKAFNVTSPSNTWPFGNTSSSANRLGEGLGRAPSVFNWFRPGYVPPGTQLANGNLLAPEFQITNEPSLVAYVNYMASVIQSGSGDAKPDYSALIALAGDSAALLNELNLVLAAGQIGAVTLGQMKTALDGISNVTQRVYAAVTLVMASPDYLVQR